jgi:putative ABC transport system permease protein
MNVHLAAYLAQRSLRHHLTVALATVLGVAIGMTVVGAILIVDHNSIETRIRGDFPQAVLGQGFFDVDTPRTGSEQRSRHADLGQQSLQRILRVTFERSKETRSPPPAARFPTQEGQVKSELVPEAPPTRRGEEDYQAMRLAVRLASLMTFSVGAVIVFYTMRFSVASRSRELTLLLCLGERRGNVALSLLVEAAILGLVGTLAGVLLAFPLAALLIGMGITTTGREPGSGFAVPWPELGGMALLSLLIALLGVLGPVRSLARMRIVEVLQPRFLSPQMDGSDLHLRGFAWLVPPLMAGTYLAVRPFLRSWLSVVEFFVFEALFAGVLTVAILWWTTPLLRGVIHLVEAGLKPILPLETLLAGRRLRLTSRKLVFTIASVTLVFSLLTALHDITRALKDEIDRWSLEALYPYVFFERKAGGQLDEEALRKTLERRDLYFFRLSAKVGGELPIRLVAAADVNPFLHDRGRPTLGPGKVMVSRTLAARFDLSAGDRVLILTDRESHRFEIVDVTDTVGFFAEDGQYVDLKSYFLFSDGNPLFANNLERSLGDYAVARKRGVGAPSSGDGAALQAHYRAVKRGWELGAWQQAEIDRDFLIFDFVLIMTGVLAAVGVTNNILIQVHARKREFSVLRTVGVSRDQTTRVLLVEGAIIGLVSAMLALVLGHTLGAISVAFLDRFTLFEYVFVFSLQTGVLVSFLAVATCCLAAVYPALLANRISSAESLHYE